MPSRASSPLETAVAAIGVHPRHLNAVEGIEYWGQLLSFMKAGIRHAGPHHYREPYPMRGEILTERSAAVWKAYLAATRLHDLLAVPNVASTRVNAEPATDAHLGRLGVFSAGDMENKPLCKQRLAARISA